MLLPVFAKNTTRRPRRSSMLALMLMLMLMHACIKTLWSIILLRRCVALLHAPSGLSSSKLCTRHRRRCSCPENEVISSTTTICPPPTVVIDYKNLPRI
jgi:hypothetical protein